MAEHMLILGVEYPDGQVKYISAAFPSACGKTNLAMLIPPEIYKNKGYKVWCVGDDIAWLRVGDDGRLWAVNPENGFFGVAPGTNEKSNPNALHTSMKNAIFTNVCHNLDDNTVWWEGLNDNPPVNALNWKGEKWDYTKYDKSDKVNTSGAHPNSRFTAKAINCPCLSDKFNDPAGVPISAIVFGGRRAKTAPLVYQSFGWQHGAFVGSIMASETTAAAAGAVGVVRRDPMAMRPFVGYDMGDYWAHWLNMGKKLTNPPKIFHVNWFRTDDEGHFIWPGFGDNMRVLMWILGRCDGTMDADETAIGFVPKAEDINIEGLDNNPPKNALNWKGEKWDYAKYDKADKVNTSGAHPNSRFTAMASNCPCLSDKFNDPAGVPVSAIVFGGRRAKTAPLVYQSTSWQNGTFVGSIMASETTAAAAGAVGVVRRDPMAMRPFVGYDMGDYWAHWLNMGKKIANPPKIFHVNWFRTDDEGHFVWPGFGDNMRVLDWILARCEGKVDAKETAIGYVPFVDDINIDGLDLTKETLADLLSVDKELWLEDCKGIHEFYAQVGERVPAELYEELAALEARLAK